MSASRVSASHQRDLEKAALRGEPSYVWRTGQERRLNMILSGAGDCLDGIVLDNGCGVGAYTMHLSQKARRVIGMEYDLERATEARHQAELIINGAGEALPFSDGSISLILSHEVLEHVSDDRLAAAEMVRVLKPGGRLALFVPNRGYPFETHGIYWHNEYHFGNVPLVNYLPRSLRDRLAPHVRIYSTKDLERLFTGFPVSIRQRTIIFGAYDNVIARYPRLGRGLRKILQGMERTPLRIFGLSHFWVIEKIGE